jgi:hypothetical protein
MNNRTSLLSNPLVLGIGGLVVGILIGWLLLGWVLFPVQYTNAELYDLNPAAKQQWVVTVADAYAVNQDLGQARERLRGFTPDEIAQSLKAEFGKRNTTGDATGAARLNAFAQIYGLNLAGGAPSATPAPARTTGGGLGGNIGTILLLLALVILLVALGLYVYMRMRSRPAALRPAPAAPTAPSTAAVETGEIAAQPSEISSAPAAAAAAAPPVARPGTTPLAKSLGTFAATYKFGEDNYDTSFTLETARGEFLGETGMGSSETIGEGKPDKVTAFDVWLFDKTDVRTVTQILMSEAAFNDQATRQRLATKGELVLAEKGKTVRLETATLIVDCEIVDLVYASTPGLPPNSHFQKLIVEMVPMQK